MEEEIWKDIKGFEDFYQVSTYGRIKGLDRVITRYGHSQYWLGLILKPQISGPKRKQCFHITLCKGFKRKFKVHRLVAQAFIPNPDNLQQVNHINHDPFDNRAINLEWVNNRENSSHGVLHNKTKKNIGAHWSVKSKKWRSVIQVNSKTIHLGFFQTREEAEKAYATYLTAHALINRYKKIV